jgi:hypothetical protein
MSDYYLHYNSDTGEILSISNENIVDTPSIKIDAETAGSFMSGSKKFLHYFVDINVKTLNSKLSDNTLSSNGLTILNKSLKDGDIKVQWLNNHGWKILSANAISPVDFYIAYKNLNFIIRKISFNSENLNQLIPFEHNFENDIDNIFISTRTTDTKYGFLIWRTNDN